MDLRKGSLYHVLRDPTLGPVDVDFQYLRERTGGFAVTQRLGRGGFGDVYRGMSRCGDFFAVKRISQHLLGGLPEARAAAQRSYEREIVALSRFSHPNIVRLVAYSAPESGERALVSNTTDIQYLSNMYINTYSTYHKNVRTIHMYTIHMYTLYRQYL
jgi:serine/threonine protein kinase